MNRDGYGCLVRTGRYGYLVFGGFRDGIFGLGLGMGILWAGQASKDDDSYLKFTFLGTN